MAQRRRRPFTAEFKQEAVRLCGRGDRSIGQVARELDLAESALRRWVQQCEIDHGHDPTGALTSEELEELRTLRREVRGLREERTIVKRRRPSSRRNRREVRVCSCGAGHPCGAVSLSGAARHPQWLLRMGDASTESPAARRRPAESAHPGNPYRQPGHLRQSADLRAAPAGRIHRWPGAGRQTAARHGPDRPARQAVPAHHGQCPPPSGGVGRATAGITPSPRVSSRR